MTNPMDAGLMGQRVSLGHDGRTVNNIDSGRQAPMQPMMPAGYNNPSMENNMPDPSRQPIPTPGGMGTGGGGQNTQGDQSPWDKFNERWLNKPQGQQPADPSAQPGQQPANQPPANNQQQQQEFNLAELTADNFAGFAGGMDFTKNIPDELMAMFQPDENGQMPNMTQGIMGLMNHVGRQAYAQAMAGGGRLAAHGIQKYGTSFQNELPQHLQRFAAEGVMKSMNIPKAFAPSVEKMVQTALANNPNASPEDISAMLTEFMEMTGLGSPKGSEQQQGSGSGLADLFN